MRFGTPLRHATGIILVDDSKIDPFIDALYRKGGSRSILLIGPPFSGKTSFLEKINRSARQTVVFNQHQILSQIMPANNTLYPQSVYSAMRKLESVVWQAYCAGNDMALTIKETRGAIPQSRYIEGVDKENIDVLVFDAPHEELLRRAMKKMEEGGLEYDTEATLSVKIEQALSTFQWPEKRDRYRSVYYVCHKTEDSDTSEYLLKTVEGK